MWETACSGRNGQQVLGSESVESKEVTVKSKLCVP